VEWSKRDRYGRILGKVLLDGNDVNVKMVEAGLAWFYRRYAHEQSPSDAMRYADAENEAREKHIGLWTDARAVAPWEWRKTNKARRGRPTGE
jgi:micrococcal nuclease